MYFEVLSVFRYLSLLQIELFIEPGCLNGEVYLQGLRAVVSLVRIIIVEPIYSMLYELFILS